MYERHDVVIPAYVGFEDFACAWVGDVWTVGVGDWAGEIAYDAVAGVFHRHGGVVLGPFFAADCVFEACFLKGFLPVVDACDEVFAPLLGGGWVYVVDDGLDGLYELALTHFFDVFGAWFEAVA